jgi:hypothetical protein
MQLVFGDGSGDPTSVCATIQPTDYNSLKFTGQQEFPGTTAEPLTLKSTYLWEDSAGKLRYKKGGAKPTSDAQGTVLASVPLATASISASGPLDFTIPTSGYTSYVFEIQGVGSNTTTVGPIILCSFDGTNFVTSGYEVAGYTLLKTGVIAYHNTTPSGVPLLVAGNTFSASGGLTGYVWFNNGYFTWQLGGLVKNGAANLHAISVGAASGGGSPAKIRFTTSSSGLDTGNIVLRGFVK